MSVPRVKLGKLSVSKLIIGGNPFTGYSHQSPERNREMVHYYTTARIKATLAQAESLGIDTFIGRADRHIRRVLLEYWDEGGRIRWIAQTCPEYATVAYSIAAAAQSGAAACYLHGGQADLFFAQGQTERIAEAVARIRDTGLPAGIAGHNPRVFEWADEHIEVDFYMCSYYNPSPRDEHAEHREREAERFDHRDREAMTAVIANLSKPVIHYKVMAAGRNDPRDALAYVVAHMRPQDAVCIGVYTKDKPDMLAENLGLLQEYRWQAGQER